MKTMKKALAIILSMLIFCTFSFISAGAETELAKTYDRQSYVVIQGTTTADHAGYNADLLLVKASADLDDIQVSDIGYIGQTAITEDGSYQFEFYFDGFTYDNSGNVDNYIIVLNVDGTDMSKTITRVEVLSDLVTYTIDYTNFGRAIATITNEYDLKAIPYTMIVGFYNSNGTLIKAITANKHTGDDPAVTYGYNDVPADAATSKAFIWESLSHMVPVTQPQSFDVTAFTENREVMMLSIAPGIDETQRNFSWYDLPGTAGARIQYALKTSDADLTTFPEANAIEVAASCGEVDVEEYIGATYGSHKFSHDVDYSWGKATIANLEAGKEYVYRIGDRFGWCKGIYSFKTDANPEDGFKAIFMNDEHFTSTVGNRYNTTPTASREKALDIVPDASIIYSVGDNVDLPWYEEAYRLYFDREGMTSIPQAAVPGGTHDYMFGNQSATLFGYHFNMPNQSQTGFIKNLGGNYWYTYGDVLFINIIENLPKNLEQTKAFIKEASDANTDAKWKILVLHYPLGNHTDGEASLIQWSALAEDDFVADNSIDLVLSGHTHRFLRTKPMLNGAATQDVITDGNILNPAGVTYINMNTSGMLSGGYGTTAPDYAAAYDDVSISGTSGVSSEWYYSHFTVMEADTSKSDSTTLKVTTYQNKHPRTNPGTVSENYVIDEFTITKTK